MNEKQIWTEFADQGETEKNKLKLMVNKSYSQCKRTQAKLRRVRRVYESLNKQFKADKTIYEELDYKLALLDERLTKCKKGGKKKDENLLVKLDKSQILAIAEALGISLENAITVEERQDEEVRG